MTRKWKLSGKSNQYIKVKDHLIVLYHNKERNRWKYALDKQFCAESYATREECMEAAFEALEKVIGTG